MFDHLIALIQEALPDAEVEIRDPRNDGVHLEAVVTSPSFRGMSMLMQHRLVMNALKSEFQENLHALAVKTRVPE